jgi:hypothetical protein
MTKRSVVYEVLDGERDYQDEKWGPTASHGIHTSTEFLVFMRDYIEEALHIESRESLTTADAKALDIIRKATAMGVACMEQNGAPARKKGLPSIGGCSLGVKHRGTFDSKDE